MNSCVIRTLILHGNSVPRKGKYRTQKVEEEHEKSFYGFMSFQGQKTLKAKKKKVMYLELQNAQK